MTGEPGSDGAYPPIEDDLDRSVVEEAVRLELEQRQLLWKAALEAEADAARAEREREESGTREQQTAEKRREPKKEKKRAARTTGAQTSMEAEPQLAEGERDDERAGLDRGAAAELAYMRKQVAELRHSYYLNGARKKLDIRDLPEFGDVARAVVTDSLTNMGYDRLYMLWQAARTAPRHGCFAEVGVYRGGSARLIADTLRSQERTQRLYVCDTFAGHPRTDPEIDTVHHRAAKFVDASVDDVRRYLAHYPQLEIVVGDFIETSSRLAKKRFAFVHVDVDVHPATAFCLDFFAERLVPDGVIVLDDYGFVTCPGAKKAADDFIAARADFRLFHLLTGQAIISRRQSRR